MEITQQDFAKMAQENRTQYTNIDIAVPPSSDPSSPPKAFEIQLKRTVNKGPGEESIQRDTIAHVHFAPSAPNSQTGSVVAVLSEPNPKFVEVVFKQIQGVKGTAEIFGCAAPGTEETAAQMFVSALMNGNKVKFEDSTKSYLQNLAAPNSFEAYVTKAINNTKGFLEQCPDWQTTLSNSLSTAAKLTIRT